MTHNTQAFPGGPSPHKMAKGFEAPPTIKRSGSENRGRLHPLVPEGREAW